MVGGHGSCVVRLCTDLFRLGYKISIRKACQRFVIVLSCQEMELLGKWCWVMDGIWVMVNSQCIYISNVYIACHSS